MNNNFYISLNVYVVCLCLFCIIFEVIGIKVIVWINFLLFINGNIVNIIIFGVVI